LFHCGNNLYSNPARKAELIAMRACCNVCNQAAEDLGLTREVLAYYRERIALERELAAAQAATAAAEQVQVQWAGFDGMLLFWTRAGPVQPSNVSQ
jgi:hypothetical protein